MTDGTETALANAVIRYLSALVNAPEVSPLPPELEGNKELEALRDVLLDVREHLTHVSSGDLSHIPTQRGYLAGLLKRHSANLRHLTWQVEQVSQGDFSQRVDFMGEFSEAFNKMVVQLDETLTSHTETKRTLTDLTDSLRTEVDLRSTAVKALQKSEARFKYLADHDPLTGALNRRSFMLIAEAGMRTAKQANKPCCIALLDVDFFKKFNDTYGHLDGDAALKHVVGVGTASLRQSDSLGRYGGEEFIFFFGNTDREQGLRAADRIRRAISKTPVPLSSRSALLTVSMGLSVILPEWPDDRDAAFVQKSIAMADAALYQAKKEGRNRVCAAPEMHPTDWDELGSCDFDPPPSVSDETPASTPSPASK